MKKVLVKDIEPTLDKILAGNRKKINLLLKNQKQYSWKSLITPIENLDDHLDQMWGPVSHLNNVMNTAELRDVYNQCLPKLVDYHSELSHNTSLYHAIKSLKRSALNQDQRKVIQDSLRDFKLSGVSLSANRKNEFTELEKQLSTLTTKFEENILDATHAWSYHITDKKLLNGLPEHVIHAAREAAKNKKEKGWRLSLDFPIYYAVMTYATNRSLRKKMYWAYATRASEQGPTKKKYDNSKIMEAILSLRYRLANLVNFKNYADYSLTTKMAKKPQEVLDFLNSLLTKVKPIAKKEFKTLAHFALKQGKIKKLEAWDIAYYSELLKKSKYNISQEILRPYFPEDKVLNGMFKLVETIYGIKIKEKHHQEVWHKDVRFFEVYNNKNHCISSFYTDLYARTKKRGGAWMDECRTRRKLENNKIQKPIAFLTCNFSKPVGKKPSLLTHDEVLTLFHEFGHCLQLLLTKVNYPEISGINGVEWDAVELPSQFMENFCWQKPVIDLISAHYKTGKPLPDELFKQLVASKNFQAGMFFIRQLEFGLFDFRLHNEYSPKRKMDIQKLLNKVRKKTALHSVPEFNRFQHSFSHIFAGGYAAGYYSYLWAEVLSCDAFEKFIKTGIFNKKTGKSFLKNILEKGGSEPALELFKKFRGRKPKIDALLKQNGITK